MKVLFMIMSIIKTEMICSYGSNEVPETGDCCFSNDNVYVWGLKDNYECIHDNFKYSKHFPVYGNVSYETTITVNTSIEIHEDSDCTGDKFVYAIHCFQCNECHSTEVSSTTEVSTTTAVSTTEVSKTKVWGVIPTEVQPLKVWGLPTETVVQQALETSKTKVWGVIHPTETKTSSSSSTIVQPFFVLIIFFII